MLTTEGRLTDSGYRNFAHYRLLLLRNHGRIRDDHSPARNRTRTPRVRCVEPQISPNIPNMSSPQIRRALMQDTSTHSELVSRTWQLHSPLAIDFYYCNTRVHANGDVVGTKAGDRTALAPERHPRGACTCRQNP